jgi:hypothetical protein
MNTAAFFFMAGGLLALVCGLRLYVRLFQLIEATRPWKERLAWDWPHILLRTKLKDTVSLELLGAVTGGISMVIALQLLKPA